MMTGYVEFNGRQIGDKTPEELLRDDRDRQLLETAARRIEALSGSETYRKAFKAAAKSVREMKP